MDPAVFLVPVGSIVAIIAAIYVAAAKIIRLRATLPESPSADVTARLQALERGVQDLQQELAETQERLDFAERLLSKAREERRIGS
jgi:prefoldin subunit 5